MLLGNLAYISIVVFTTVPDNYVKQLKDFENLYTFISNLNYVTNPVQNLKQIIKTTQRYRSLCIHSIVTTIDVVNELWRIPQFKGNKKQLPNELRPPSLLPGLLECPSSM